MSTTVNEIDIQTHSSFSVHFEVLTKSVIDGALEQGYLRLLANPAYLFIAPENMRALLGIVLAQPYVKALTQKLDARPSCGREVGKSDDRKSYGCCAAARVRPARNLIRIF